MAQINDSDRMRARELIRDLHLDASDYEPAALAEHVALAFAECREAVKAESERNVVAWLKQWKYKSAAEGIEKGEHLRPRAILEYVRGLLVQILDPTTGKKIEEPVHRNFAIDLCRRMGWNYTLVPKPTKKDGKP